MASGGVVPPQYSHNDLIECLRHRASPIGFVNYVEFVLVQKLNFRIYKNASKGGSSRAQKKANKRRYYQYRDMINEYFVYFKPIGKFNQPSKEENKRDVVADNEDEKKTAALAPTI